MDRKEMAAVMMADGPWEQRPRGGMEWSDCKNPLWNWIDYSYRVKPQPKVIWVNENGKNMEAYPSKGHALEFAQHQHKRVAVRYVESPRTDMDNWPTFSTPAAEDEYTAVLGG